MSSNHSSWVVSQLQNLLPLPEEDLKQVVDYAATLSTPEEVAQHFQGLLEDSPATTTFVSDLNSRLFPSSPSPASQSHSASGSGYRQTRNPRKQKKPLNSYPNAPRQANEGGLSSSLAPPSGVGVYIKKDVEDEYYTGGKSGGNSAASSRKPSPAPSSKSSNPSPRKNTPGMLTSDLPNVRTKQAKASSSPAITQSSSHPHKVTISGGSSMRGAGYDIASLESALRSLEVSTNPTLTIRRCDCQGLQHEPFAAAPNCMSCGYIICMLNGPSPCNFCGTPPLSSSDTQAMIRVLRDERGKEKMALDAAAHQKATMHRDKLLGFQRDNAQRTKIIDQAGDWDVGDAGSGMWMSPTERALQLKKQQKAMEKIQWANKQDYEKRRVVVSIDLQGRRVVKHMQDIPAPGEEEEEVDEEEAALVRAVEEERQKRVASGSASGSGGGTFARNPLLKGLVRPVYNAGKGKGKALEPSDDLLGAVGGYANRDLSKWRRVQDSLEDNEGVLLDGPRIIQPDADMEVDGPCG